MARVFFHSAASTRRRNGSSSASHLRLRNENSTLCSNTTFGRVINWRRGAAVCRKSQKMRSNRLRLANSPTAWRKSGPLHLERQYGQALHWFGNSSEEKGAEY